MPRIALTSGEPAGIGPDLCLAIAAQQLDCDLVCLGDREMLTERARMLGVNVELHPYDDKASSRHIPGTLAVEHHPLRAPVAAGQLDARNGPYVIRLLERACDGAISGEFAAIVTAPVNKGVLNDAGIPFTGHTEFLAAQTHAPLPVMMLATASLRVALATTHLPLARVSDAITTGLLCEVLAIIDRDVARWWGIERPRIAVCGLNPHAGESGHLGDEEIRVITPALARMRERGLRVSGPLPADTVFVPRVLADFDVVLAMYHDQGLPVIKHSGFESAVNVTLGLPILRTSVDHGTALDLAGTGLADAGSMAAAIDLAVQLASRTGVMRPAGRESRPRKRFGQHFLHDPAVIERIAAAIAPQSGDAVVEIGPGRGALTGRLLASDCGSLDAIEIDRDLAALLRTEWGSDSRFHLHNEDALQVDFGALARRRGRRLRVVGNLPYNISTPLLFHLLQSVSDIHDLHVMLQREVIARMAALPGDRAYGRLTVMLAPWVQVERLFDVGPGAFRPPPRVWSAVARLVVRTGPAFPLCPAFPAVVAAAFSHRRKTLRNALRGFATAEQIEACGVDPSARPETISPALFNAIAGKVKLPSG